jgi:glycosyltransferase involved in cell wall biosynthesis
MSLGGPTVSVVLPVLDRPDFLRRALASVASQTWEDFECIVVDDGSTTPLEPVVRELDDRFVYLRRERNGGPVAARLTGYARVRGDIVVKLDSDDELLPHALARAVALLDGHHDVSAAIGLAYLDGRLPLRVRGGCRVVEPSDYVRRAPPPFDVTDVVRADVVREWVERLPEFFKEEFAFKLSLGLQHRVLYIDEAWDVHHADAPNRMSRSFDDPRWLSDVRMFVGHFRPLLGARRCAPLDQYLVHRRRLLARLGHHEEAGLVADWLDERGIGPLRRARTLLKTRFRDRRSYRV